MWGDKPYFSLDYFLKQTFGEKVYKLALDGGMSCPNRDGALGTGGCIFCSHGGSGEFAERVDGTPGSVFRQIEAAKRRVSKKIENGRYIAYFQSYTNTYAPLPYLKCLFSEAVNHPDIVALSIGTRPDCLGPEVIGLLKELNRQKPVWVELGLQTIHEDTARFIRRGYELPCFQKAFQDLKEAGLTVIVHVILGLPGETKKQMLQTVSYLGDLPVDGIKLQLLHVLRGTELARHYEATHFPLMSLEEYISLIGECIRILPPSVVVHRISGDGPKSLLIAPQWSANKRLVLNSISRHLKKEGIFQGMDRCPTVEPPAPLT